MLRGGAATPADNRNAQLQKPACIDTEILRGRHINHAAVDLLRIACVRQHRDGYASSDHALRKGEQLAGAVCTVDAHYIGARCTKRLRCLFGRRTILRRGMPEKGDLREDNRPRARPNRPQNRLTLRQRREGLEHQAIHAGCKQRVRLRQHIVHRRSPSRCVEPVPTLATRANRADHVGSVTRGAPRYGHRSSMDRVVALLQPDLAEPPPVARKGVRLNNLCTCIEVVAMDRLDEIWIGQIDTVEGLMDELPASVQFGAHRAVKDQRAGAQPLPQ